MRPSAPTSPLTLAALLALAATGCTTETAEPARRNALLISIDTLRADHLEPYGEELPTSPAIDAFARGAVVFENAQATSSWTLPSLTSMVTGLEAWTHGCSDYDTRLGSEVGTLAEHLVGFGFLTGAVASQGLLGRHYGLSRGFADYDDELVYEVGKASLTISSDKISDKGIAWLEEAARIDTPWFLWLHYFDPHARYLKHDDLMPMFGEPNPGSLYRNEIAFTDRHVGRVLDAVERLGLDETTAIVLTSDHGEEFLEHGAHHHGATLFREVVHVPFIVRAPGSTPGRVGTPVSLTDVPATLLDLVGVPPLPADEGRSLRPLLEGRTLDSRPAIARLDRTIARAYDAIIDERWKLIRHRGTGAESLYDTDADPDEQNDVASAHPDVVRALGAELDARYAASATLRSRLGTSSSLNVGNAERQALEDLGYLGDE